MFRYAILFCCLMGGLALATDVRSSTPVPSLANIYRAGVDLKRYWVSEKLDGVRALWDGEALYSRRGNRFNAPAWFIEGFPAQALDGELWMGRGTFESLSRVVRRQVPDNAAWLRIRFMVFDRSGPSPLARTRRARSAMSGTPALSSDALSAGTRARC